MDANRPNQVRVDHLTRDLFRPAHEPSRFVAFLRAMQIPLITLIAACAVVGGMVSDDGRDDGALAHRFVGVEPDSSGAAPGGCNVHDLTY